MWCVAFLSSAGDSGAFAILLRSWASSSSGFLLLLVAGGGKGWETRETRVAEVVLWGGSGLASDAMVYRYL
jgi:hypothetical protein